MNINWFPGHMKKTRELLQNNLKLVDVVFELLDSRIPTSSRNPEINKIVGDKPRVIIMNKFDLSSEDGNRRWAEYFNKSNASCVFVNASKNVGTDKIVDEAYKVMRDKLERLRDKGIKNKTIRAMIVGIPNVGKSTLINALAGRKGAKTGNRPGVTTGKQWIKLKGNLELLDTPGILWPKFEDEDVGLNLAFTGAIKDEIMDIETLSLKLIEKIKGIDTHLLQNRYGITIEDETPLQTLEEIAARRGCIIRGGEVDYSRVAHIVLNEYRSGMIGRITLEYPFNIK